MAARGYYCAQCTGTFEAYTSPCPKCGAHNSLISGSPRDGGWVRASGGPRLLKDVERKIVDKLETGTREFDRVLGGGFAFEGAYSLSGPPGAGKSTLCRQVLIDVVNMEMLPKDDGTRDIPYKVLYEAGEETAGQVAQGTDRIGKDTPNFWIENQTDVLEIEKSVARIDPDVLVIDSTQTLTRSDLDVPAGSPLAVKACASHLVGMCKARGVILILICHVTKDGQMAGPKLFEHLVDGCLMFEEEPPFRVLRMSKHRFGPTTEIGLFRMTSQGLVSVENPSELLLESHIDGVSGSVIGALAEGSRGDASRAMLV
ncbi:MAG: AAA family ATPase, partial [Acidimicrobiales bacterium]